MAQSGHQVARRDHVDDDGIDNGLWESLIMKFALSEVDSALWSDQHPKKSLAPSEVTKVFWSH